MLSRFNYLALISWLLIPLSGFAQEVPPVDDRISSPEKFNRHLTRLSPALIQATVAVMVPPGSGSGVIVSPDGLVMTAAHVTVVPGKKIEVLLSDGRRLPATALGVDHSTDGALIQINAPGPFPFRPYISEKNYQEGDWVIATGHPGGPIKNRKSPVRLGRILASGSDSGFSDPITTSTTIISGDSGGPLFNLNGEVIGINSNIGRSYFRNNHVPLPSMLAQWQPLLDGETIGKRPAQAGGGSPNEANRSLFDEPYADLRDRFHELMEAQESDPDVAELLARPRLLDPHHMQEKLDQWYPSGELPEISDDESENEDEEVSEVEPRKRRPWLGVVPELLVSGSVEIRTVESGSPAEKAGLKSGDQIVKINQTAISSVAEMAALLAETELGQSIQIALADGREVIVKPEPRLERMFFPPPIAGMIQMRVTDGGGAQPGDHSRFGFLNELANSIADDNSASVVAIKRANKTMALATVISNTGELLTKASELKGLTDGFSCRQGGVEVLAVDKESDLALLKTAPEGLKPVVWHEKSPRVGSLVFTAGTSKPITGVVTQKMRANPPLGYENAQSSDAPKVWIGTTYTRGNLEPIVARVALSSPADVAGILEGDEIIAVEGKSVESITKLNSLLKSYLVGDKVRLEIDRSGVTKDIAIILANVPDGLVSYSKAAAARDQSLATTSRWGGELNSRRNDFPICIYHDAIIQPNECGAPLFDMDGNAIGINIARSFRHRSLALPASEVLARIDRLQMRAQNR